MAKKNKKNINKVAGAKSLKLANQKGKAKVVDTQLKNIKINVKEKFAEIVSKIDSDLMQLQDKVRGTVKQSVKQNDGTGATTPAVPSVREGLRDRGGRKMSQSSYDKMNVDKAHVLENIDKVNLK